jgi:cell division protease FtsH
VQRIIEECHEEAKRLIAENRAALDALVKALMERETIGEEEILEVTGITPPPAPDNRPLALDG